MNSYLLKNAYLYYLGQFQNVDLLIKDGYIVDIDRDITADVPVIDLQGRGAVFYCQVWKYKAIGLYAVYGAF